MSVLVIAAVAGGAVHSARAAGRPTWSSRGSAGYAGPARDRAVLPSRRGGTGSLASRNWAGYISNDAAGGTDFNAIKSTWVQPAVTCEAKNAWTVFWVGLDGWFDGTVEQGGSSAQCVRGVPQYTLWWEMFPTNSIQTMNTISAGDTVTASVTYDPSTKRYQIKVRDVTTGKGFTRSEKCASDLTCDRSSTDVIAEDVGRFGGSSFFPLADYGTMQFTKSTITDVNGASGGFRKPAWEYAAITEQQGKKIYATISALSDGGKTFSATWQRP